MTLSVPVQRLRDDVPLPRYATDGAAGLDVTAAQAALLYPGQRSLIKTGLKMAVPPGWECQVRPRSGLALNRGVTVLNSPGTIDSDYRGEVGIVLVNHSEDPFVVNVGDRIAQLVFVPVGRAVLEVVDVLPETDRGEGAFGSTGVR